MMPLNVRVFNNTVVITYDKEILGTNSPFSILQLSLRGLEGVDITQAYAENGQLIVLLSESLFDKNLNFAGIVYTPSVIAGERITYGEDTDLPKTFIPLSTAEVSCKDGDCPPEGDTLEGGFSPLRIDSIKCNPTSLFINFSEFLSPSYIPPLDSFLIKYSSDSEPAEFLQSLEIQGGTIILNFTPETAAQMSGSSIISYEPPAENFLRTMEIPYRIISPFNFRLACRDSDFDTNPEGDCPDSVTHQNGLGIPYNVRNGECATVDDYITVYSLEEAIQVSNIGNGAAVEVNQERMSFVLDQAAQMLDNYIKIASWAGKAMLLGTFKMSQLIIARYLLHSQRRPKDVLEDYTRLIQWVDQVSASQAVKPSDCNKATLGSGRVLAAGFSQQYNVENGLGLRGWMRMFDNEELYRIQNGGYLPEWMLQKLSYEGVYDSAGNRVG